MQLSECRARAVTREMRPGEDRSEGGRARYRGHEFQDVVLSSDDRIRGENRLTLDLDLDPATGSGGVAGSFTLTLEAGNGAWSGRISGTIAANMVRAVGMARGTGHLDGASLWLSFEQVPGGDGGDVCPNPIAFYDLQGWILEADA